MYVFSNGKNAISIMLSVRVCKPTQCYQKHDLVAMINKHSIIIFVQTLFCHQKRTESEVQEEAKAIVLVR
jgi:hypothetical protein